jgi:hypothetical protein
MIVSGTQTLYLPLLGSQVQNSRLAPLKAHPTLAEGGEALQCAWYSIYIEKVIIRTTAAGEYIALSGGNEASKFVREVLKYFGNTQHVYHLYTDNQAAEHLATQPNMNDHWNRGSDITIQHIRHAHEEPPTYTS